MENYDVFISYSREDIRVVSEFIRRFEEEGLRVWVDLDGIESGDAFKRVIVKAIRNSSTVLFFSSGASNTSEWTPKEIGVAIHYQKTVIPVRLDHSKYNDEVEFDLVGLDYIDYTNSATQKQMMDKLVSTLVKRKGSNGNGDFISQDAGRIRHEPIIKKRRTINYWLVGVGIALTLALLAAILLFWRPGKDKPVNPDDPVVIQPQHTGGNMIPSSGGGEFMVNGVSFKMIEVEGGSFIMGCTGETGCDCYDEEKPKHEVTVSSFCIGETEVTQALYIAVMGKNPSYFKGDDLPVENVTWDDCVEFIGKLNMMTGREFRLPTEAEWEFAARGGNKSTEIFKYSGSNNLSEVAWYDDNSEEKTHPVRKKFPNALGIYDMSGNVWEWCSDWYASYDVNPQRDPQGHADGCYRVRRGGNWRYGARFCRVSYRYSGKPVSASNYVGFRLALVP